MRRVVITGMGAITPVGLSVEEFWNSVKEGKTNFAEVTRFDSTNYRAHMAAEINNFNPKDYMDFKSAKRMELFSQYAVAAAKEAIEQSGLDMTKEDPFRVGCSVGSGIGSMQVVEKSCEILNTKGPGRLNPLMIPLLISNMASGNVSIQFGLRGKNINVVTACATGTHSIGEAYRTIQCSDADVMVAGGTEAAITPTGFGGFAALTALTSSTDPERCSKKRFCNGRGCRRGSSGRTETCQSTWSENPWRGCRIWCNRRCLPHYIPCRGRFRCCQSYGMGCERSRNFHR